MCHCREKFKCVSGQIHPHSKFKFYWDSFIILLSLLNGIYVPMEIAFSVDNIEMEILNYLMDVIFIADIVVNFRTIFFDPRTSDPVKSSKLIALNYIKGGRFFLDVIASLPLEVIGDLAGAKISKGTLKLIGLIKLTRLLRLGKIVTYIKMKKSFKHGIRLFILGLYLFLIIHWLCCASYYIFSIDLVWIPPLDIIPNMTVIYEGLEQGYLIMLYYGALFVLSNDPLPQSVSEIAACIFFVFLGSITMGLLIGQFSSIINGITKQARIESDKIDFIQQMMFILKIPEEGQMRILQYYEQSKKSQFILGAKRLKILAPSLVQKISDHQLQKLYSNIPIIKSSDDHLASLFSKHTIVQMFLPGDVIVKQGDEGEFFNIIIQGYVSVLREKKDIKMNKFHGMVDESLIQQKQLTFWEKVKAKFQRKKPDINIPNLARPAEHNNTGDSRSRNRRAGFFVVTPQEQEDVNKNFTKLRDLYEGNYFGEISMLTNLKVTATVYSLYYTSCAQIPGRKFDKIIKHAPELRKRLMKRINKYQDVIFSKFIDILKNAFVFKHLNNQTLQKISYLFKQERHLQGKVLIRKREKSDLIFFVLKGEIAVRFPYNAYDKQVNDNSPEGNKFPDLLPKVFEFARINEGGYFNLSTALLKKFSIFEFTVLSKKAELMVLNAADLVLQSRKSEDLYYALQSHAVLYEVDGQKYDYNRFIKVAQSQDEIDTEEQQNKNKNKLIRHIVEMKNQGFFRDLLIFQLIDDLFDLRRKKYIKQKREQYLKELRDKMVKNMTWFKSFQIMQKQAHAYHQEFTEETEEQLMKLVDQTQDEEMLLNQFKKQFTKTADSIEKQINKFIIRKCRRMGVEPEKVLELIQQDKYDPNTVDDQYLNGMNGGIDYQEVFDEDYQAAPSELAQTEQINTMTLSDGHDTMYYDIKELIDQEKMKQQSISREKVMRQLDQLNISTLTKQKSFVVLGENDKLDLRQKIKKIKEKYQSKAAAKEGSESNE